MKLLTKKILKQLPPLMSQSKVKDPIVPTVFFNPIGRGYWFPYEYDPETKTFFGYVSIFGDWNDEFGYFTLAELEEYKGMLGLGIERDMHWTPKPLSEACEAKRVTSLAQFHTRKDA